MRCSRIIPCCTASRWASITCRCAPISVACCMMAISCGSTLVRSSGSGTRKLPPTAGFRSRKWSASGRARGRRQCLSHFQRWRGERIQIDFGKIKYRIDSRFNDAFKLLRTAVDRQAVVDASVIGGVPLVVVADDVPGGNYPGTRSGLEKETGPVLELLPVIDLTQDLELYDGPAMGVEDGIGSARLRHGRGYHAQAKERT